MNAQQDRKWMRAALRLAEKGGALVSPNPMVGACVVRGSKIVGQGYHRRFGSDHAEVIALQKAGKLARGATLYVTLEPCSSWGKTPPCIDAIINARIRRVVVAVNDANPKHRGGGIRALRRRGVKVKVGVLSQEAAALNRAFFYMMKSKMPFITLKMAQTIDGKIASVSGKSKWISSNVARKFVHDLRRNADAIMVGKNTAVLDNPGLSVRYGKSAGLIDKTKPWRVVLDPQGKLKTSAKVFKGSQTTIRVVSKKNLARFKKGKRSKGNIVLSVAEKKGNLDLRSLCKKLASLGVMNLLVEGGGELAWSLLKENLVARGVWIISPKILGGRDAKTSVEGTGFISPDRALEIKSWNMKPLGTDILLETFFNV